MEISGIPRLETLGIEPGTITKGSVATGTGTNIYRYNRFARSAPRHLVKKIFTEINTCITPVV